MLRVNANGPLHMMDRRILELVWNVRSTYGTANSADREKYEQFLITKFEEERNKVRRLITQSFVLSVLLFLILAGTVIDVQNFPIKATTVDVAGLAIILANSAIFYSGVVYYLTSKTLARFVRNTCGARYALLTIVALMTSRDDSVFQDGRQQTALENAFRTTVQAFQSALIVLYGSVMIWGILLYWPDLKLSSGVTIIIYLFTKAPALAINIVSIALLYFYFKKQNMSIKDSVKEEIEKISTLNS